MPYEISFSKKLSLPTDEHYINDCCVGGDFILEQLLPQVKNAYANIASAQEDWGWFIWCNQGKTHCAIEVCCEDIQTGHYLIHLHAHTKQTRWLLFTRRTEDRASLDTLHTLVINTLASTLDLTPLSRYTREL